ncbi:hypothetical protein [Sphingomonas sp. CFBP 8760]|uniref:hypothetical protein n=1 Tax=Sphingomonas sp. CFBP 8760 TaxID=2775282 RepID=UPI0017867284|nr:hypothetical protein [Sphingomonas sp. CFBP 8760]MBD8548981.1 hypothetical protein [Sphingomonas sp. CFBP 8760]
MAGTTVTLHPMTNDSFELIAAARRAAGRAWRDGYAYTKAGVLNRPGFAGGVGL